MPSAKWWVRSTTRTARLSRKDRGCATVRMHFPRVEAVAMIRIALITTILAAWATSASAAPPKTISGTVGFGYEIHMSAKTLKHGTYRLVIHDRSPYHDFHLTGPGVDVATDVGTTETRTVVLKLRKGVYRYFCDSH